MFAIIMAHTHGKARAAFFLAPLIMMGEVLCDLQQPTLMAQIIDHGLARGDGHYVLMHAALMLGFALLGLVCGATCGTLGSYASLKMGEALRSDMLTIALTSRDPAGLAPATLITRITNDVTQMQNLVMMVTRGLVRSPLLLIGGIVMSTIVCPDLAPILFVIMPLLVVYLLVIVRRSLPLYTAMQQAVDRVNRSMRENLQGAKTIKSYVLEDHQLTAFNADNDHLQATSQKAALATVTLAPVIQLLLNLGVVVALGYGGSLAIAKTISSGQIIAFVNYMIQITTAMIQTVNIITAFSRAVTSATRVQAVLAEQVPATTATAPAPTDATIDFHDVSFGYDAAEPILANINLHIPAGTTFGIVGPTGSGKSSLINLLTRAFDQYTGTITIGGVDIQDLHLETVHQQLSVALQDSVLFSGTIAFNLRYGAATANDDQLAQAAHTAVADEFIDPLPQRFAAPVEQRGKNFSGGQRQRLNLARAFVPNHPIVILDDATSAVDQTTNAQIKTRLAATRRGETTIIISQRVTNVMACDQIIVLDAGRITAQGNHESLQRDSAFYQQLVATQLGGGRYAAE
ncbi:MAG: ABC transporter ATP-binding protein/permease [Lactobacillus sp.]|jgi:ABC-type multidrug transport system fused ATPase/permease subunit|nr:ABC transporter ATP-binding protein/permease [Lactobacillus sp.]MCI2033888.1 ABC transporter ATP-binding protein/permease [Lactobacillus sp.]